MVESVTEPEITLRCDIPHSTQFHLAADFSMHTLIVSAERVDGPTPGARVSWNTTAPECVASVRMEFKTSSHGSVVRSYTTNTSETEVILTGFQCPTNYYIRVRVTGVPPLGTMESMEVQKLVGGKITVCRACSYCDQVLVHAAWVLGDVW